MQLAIDCEYNGMGGELISIALVECRLENRVGGEFYAVLDCPKPQPWVEKYVIPVLGMHSVETLPAVQARLQQFLDQYPEGIELIADWPEDIAYFCRLLITAPGERIDTPQINIGIHRDIDSEKSKIPHNALEDARALHMDFRAKRGWQLR